MHTSSYIEIGTVQRKKGLDGSIIILLHVPAIRLPQLEYLFIKRGDTLVPYGLEACSLQDTRATVRLRGVNESTVAHDLKGSSVFALREALGDVGMDLDVSSQLLGYQVIDIDSGLVGTLAAIYRPTKQQQLLAVDREGEEVLIPYHESIVQSIDYDKGCIRVALPKGLIT